MPVETEKENVCINQIIGQKRAETLVEGDVIVNDVKPDVLNIISANGIACVYKKEVMDGKLRENQTAPIDLQNLARFSEKPHQAANW